MSGWVIFAIVGIAAFVVAWLALVSLVHRVAQSEDKIVRQCGTRHMIFNPRVGADGK